MFHFKAREYHPLRYGMYPTLKPNIKHPLKEKRLQENTEQYPKYNAILYGTEALLS